jgi:hypothetical protein
MTERYLRELYFNPKHPGAYGGVEKLYQAVRKDGKYAIGRHRIRTWLQNQDFYSLQRGVRHNFKRNRVMVSGLFYQFDIDLMDVQNHSESNDGIKFLLICIDVFSRFLWVEALQDKTAKSVVQALTIVFTDDKAPEKVRTDKGSEFVNRWVKDMFIKFKIKHFVTQNRVKANYAERVIRTLRVMLHRYMSQKHTHRYIDVLDDIVYNYNHRAHRSLPDKLSPAEVTEENEVEVLEHLYFPTPSKIQSIKRKEKRKPRQKSLFAFKVGDLTRISHLRRPFQKDYDAHWTKEIFKVSSRLNRQGVPVYRLRDFADDAIEGTFYNAELQKVDKNSDNLWTIDKKVRKRRRNGQIEWFVSWDGWPKKFNSWIEESELRDVQR